MERKQQGESKGEKMTGVEREVQEIQGDKLGSKKEGTGKVGGKMKGNRRRDGNINQIRQEKAN